jgi:SWI/SNF-related matrix-associated actin-dependent regulator 1 of chromatin subfamily A
MGSLLVGAHIVSGLKENGISASAVTGDTDLYERQRIVDDFQAGSIQVFVGSIRACGTGLTLTRSSNVIFAELDWTPPTIAQAEDR